MEYLATVVSGNHSNVYGTFKPGEVARISQLELDTFAHKFTDVRPYDELEDQPEVEVEPVPQNAAVTPERPRTRGRRK